MWQVVSGIVNLLSDSDLHAVVGILGILARDGILADRLRRLVDDGPVTRVTRHPGIEP
jgi:DNA-binding HxlR family transcriptional regulator